MHYKIQTSILFYTCAMERIVTFMSLLWQSMLSFIKVVLLSRPAGRAVGRIPAERLTRGVVVLGNGPSLNETVERGGLIIICLPTFIFSRHSTGKMWRNCGKELPGWNGT